MTCPVSPFPIYSGSFSSAMNFVDRCPCADQDRESLRSSTPFTPGISSRCPSIPPRRLPTYPRLDAALHAQTHHHAEDTRPLREELEHEAVGSSMINSQGEPATYNSWLWGLCRMGSRYRKGECESTTALPWTEHCRTWGGTPCLSGDDFYHLTGREGRRVTATLPAPGKPRSGTTALQREARQAAARVGPRGRSS